MLYVRMAAAKKKLFKRVIVCIAAILVVAISIEMRSKHLFECEFESNTSIEWPITPCFCIPWSAKGRASFILKTSSEEGLRFLKEVKASPLFIDADDGWQIRTDSRLYQFLFFASDARIVDIKVWKKEH